MEFSTFFDIFAEKDKMEVEYKEFTVKDNGTIKNKFGNEVGFKTSNGYIHVSSRGKQLYAHRIVWEAFNGEIPVGMEVDHINTNRSDNRLENLRLVTSSENKRNPTTLERYKQSNKGKGSKAQKIKASMNAWMRNTIRSYHKNGNKYVYKD